MPPYDPPEIYPEFCKEGPLGLRTDGSNLVYPLVREALITLGLDKEHIGTSAWNPFSDFVHGGQKIIIKPNLVLDDRFFSKNIAQACITHPSIIRPIIDYIYKATNGNCELVVADAPLEGTSFKHVRSSQGLNKTIEILKNRYSLNLKLLDFRDYYLQQRLVIKLGNYRMQIVTKKILRPNEKYFTIDLGPNSEFEKILADELQCLFSTRTFIKKVPAFAQSKGHHKYSFAKELLEADVIFNVPKLKTHKFAGVTLSLKNLLGLTVNRHYFAHYRKSDASLASRNSLLENFSSLHYKDIFAFFVSRMHSSESSPNLFITKGQGTMNDTIHRAVIDIARIVLYANKAGLMDKTPQRRHFVLVDAIIGGEGEGPLNPSPKICGVVAAGFDPVLLDALCALSMGFDPLKLKTITESLKCSKFPLTDSESLTQLLHIVNEEANFPNLHFKPPRNWEKLTSGF